MQISFLKYIIKTKTTRTWSILKEIPKERGNQDKEKQQKSTIELGPHNHYHYHRHYFHQRPMFSGEYELKNKTKITPKEARSRRFSFVRAPSLFRSTWPRPR